MINETSKQTYTTVGELIGELLKWNPGTLVSVRIPGLTMSHPLFEFSSSETKNRAAVTITIRDGEDIKQVYLRRGHVIGAVDNIYEGAEE